MAEHYGEVPPKFTKAWWEYFWMYYKWYVIVGIAVVLCALFTIAQCSSRVNYDLTVNYCGSYYYDNEEINGWEEALVPYVDDANGNGSVDVFVQQINFANNGTSAEIESAMQVKHDMELSNDGSFIFIYDKAEADLIFNRESTSDVYLELGEWVEGDISGRETILSAEGVPCAVSLEGSAMLESLGIDTSDMYISIRKDYSGEERNTSAQQSAMKAANAMLAQ